MARDRFRAAGLPTPELDARRLVAFALGLGEGELTLRGDAPVPDGAARVSWLVERRIAGEPVARIVGEQEFYGLGFALSAATLVPRPETELLVDLALARKPQRVLDLGTGSGCIAIAILANSLGTRAVAVDVRGDALVIAEENARRCGVADRLFLLEGSWFDALRGDSRSDAAGVPERFDLIVSNPPYIETEALARLMPDVRDHDPRLALDGGPDGLAAYRAILGGAPAHLAPHGTLLVEMGSRQADAVTALCRAAGFESVTVEKDLAGLDRAVVAHHLR